jgi:hypothetical protein
MQDTMQKAAVSEPIHTATVSGHPVRFHAVPGLDGVAMMPWVERDDLLAALEYGEPLTGALAMVLARDFPGAGGVILTDRGPVQGIPGWLGVETLAMLERSEVLAPAFSLEFSIGYYSAMLAAVDASPPAQQDAWIPTALSVETAEREMWPGHLYWLMPSLKRPPASLLPTG